MKQEHIVIILSTLLLLFLIWKEIKRLNRSRLALRIILSVIAVISLALLFIPVTFTAKSADGSSKKIILVTAGAGSEPDSLSRYKHITTDLRNSSANVEFIPDLSIYIAGHANDISSIHITGTGIAEHEWEMLNEYKISASYDPPVSPTGIVQADWPRSISRGSQLQVQGIYNNRSGDQVKLVLSGLGTSLDSVIIGKDSSQVFSLSCQPAHNGNTLYELHSVRSDHILSAEKLPVIIHPVVKPRILLINSSPGFESKFLGTWLYENNYPVAIKNTVSRDKYEQQFLNIKATSLTAVNSTLLENFDLLIADDNALAELSASAAAAVKLQVAKGMGLIIEVDSSRSISAFSRPFILRKQSAQQTTTRSLSWAGAASRKPQLAAGDWFAIQPDPFAQQLVTDEHQAVIAAGRLSGAGKVILNTAGTTYSWVLSGAMDSYSSFWSLLISKAARPHKKETGWRYSPAFPTVDQQTILTLEKTSVAPPVIKTGSGDLYTDQTPYLPDTWTANWWPATPGWQTLSNTDTASIYVFEETDWPAAKRTALINTNIMYAEKQSSTTDTKNKVMTATKSVPVWLFYAALLIACSFLWWERKAAE
ncbi:MAG: hypothetical protein ABW007_03565 [Chitinophagaceae bacterium]